jgi:acyl-CoA dehydrogenase
MPDWLSTLAQPPAVSLREGHLGELLAHWEALGGSAFSRAVAAGVVADRLGLAFAAGYRSALLALTGEAGFAAVCITEQGGAHPRAIETRLERRGDTVVLTGAKAWATLAGGARMLLVAASIGREGDRNDIRMVRVPADAEGVRVEAMPATPFTPEIPHARVVLDAVVVPSTAVLDGDGYTRWIKPFRTVEDIHVMAAAAAHVVGVGRRAGWPAGVIAEGIAVIAALASLAERPPLDPAVHLALGGVLGGFAAWLERTGPCWAAVEAEVRQRWERDRPILGVAGKARAARFESAAVASGLVATKPAP